MPNMIKTTLLQAETAIVNISENADIKALLANYGYDDAKLAAGLTLFTTATTLHENQLKEYGDQYSATQSFKRAVTAARETYMEHVKIARVAMKGSPAGGAKLGLSGSRASDFSGLAIQVDVFYVNALADPEVLAALAKFGITEDKLTASHAAFADTRAKYIKQKNETGEAQKSTQKRDEAVDELSNWISDFMVIARIALKNQPEMLAALGV